MVDDNRDSAQSMAMMLRLLGHEVRTAHDGLEAVEAAEAVPAGRDPDGRRDAAAERLRGHPPHPRAAVGRRRDDRRR